MLASEPNFQGCSLMSVEGKSEALFATARGYWRRQQQGCAEKVGLSLNGGGSKGCCFLDWQPAAEVVLQWVSPATQRHLWLM